MELSEHQKDINMEHYVQIDWLSIFCDCAGLKDGNGFTLKREEYSTSVFNLVDKILFEGDEVAVLAHEPRTNVCAPHTGILKVLNSWLYCDNLEDILFEVVNSCGLIALSVSRIDLATDFHLFDNGMNPQIFVNDFLAGVYLRKGKGKVKAMGENTRKTTWDYLRFGTYKTSVSAYLYNKSKEIKEASGKNYIIESWLRQGYDLNKPVWRLEFSLSGEDIKIEDQHKKTYYSKDIHKLIDYQFRTKLFVACIDKYFKFYVDEDKKRKSDNKEVKLFNIKALDLHLSRIEYADTCRFRDKILLKSLERVFDEMRVKRVVGAEVVEEAARKIILFKKYSKVEGLNVGSGETGG